MYKYLLVILEKGAVPFCHYSNPYYYSPAEPDFISPQTLGEIIGYARAHGLFLNLLYGRHPIPPKYEDLIATANHVKMVPPDLKDTYPEGVLVLEADESRFFAGLNDDSGRNIILRATVAELPQLSGLVTSLQGKFKRLNLHLVGLERFSQNALNVYETELKKIADMLSRLYRAGAEIEINVLSDRLLLQQMNNCDAGIQHLTIAPNGKGYICPAFYYDDEADTLGFWADAIGVSPGSRPLLDLSRAPICARCDAFHCKRCVYLNRNTTLEINVPSREQCRTAHVEREVSRRLLQSLRPLKPFDKFPPIPPLAYDDPFDKVVQETWRTEAPAAEEAASTDSDDYLAKIYEMQKEILRRLQTN